MILDRKTGTVIVIAVATPLVTLLIQATLEGWLTQIGSILQNWLISTSPQILTIVLGLVFKMAQARLRTALIAITLVYLGFELIVASSGDPNSAMLWAFYFPAALFLLLLVVIMPAWRRNSGSG